MRDGRGLTMLGAVAGVALALAGCTPAGDDADPSPSASSSPAATAVATASAAPEVSPSAAQATPTPTASSTTPANDQGDGVAVDPPVTAPTAQAGSTVAVATVSLTGWGQEGGAFTAAAVVEGVVKAGTCTMTLERSGARETATGPAARSASSSSCAAGLSIPLTELQSGTWTLTIAFEADGVAGATAPKEVTIP